MEKHLKLRIFIYGKNDINDISKIIKISDIISQNDFKSKINPYTILDKINKWEYLIFQNEINKDINDTIKKYLVEHYES